MLSTTQALILSWYTGIKSILRYFISNKYFHTNKLGKIKSKLVKNLLTNYHKVRCTVIFIYKILYHLCSTVLLHNFCCALVEVLYLVLKSDQSKKIKIKNCAFIFTKHLVQKIKHCSTSRTISNCQKQKPFLLLPTFTSLAMMVNAESAWGAHS